MDFLTVILFALLLIALVAFLIHNRFNKRYHNLPPGPEGYPIVGNLLNLTKDPPKQITKWSRQYGETISLTLGSNRLVVLHDYDTAKTVFNDENTTGRDPDFIFNKFFHNKGLAASEGDLWKEHRRFALSTLRDLGMGKGWFEDAILAETAELTTIFKGYSGSAFDPRPHLTLAVSNVICALVFGKRFEHSDSKFQKLCIKFGENLRLLAVITPIQFFPFLGQIPFGKLYTAWKAFFQNLADLKVFVQSLVDDHVNSLMGCKAEVDDKGDYITNYFTEKKVQQSHSKDTTFDDEQLIASVLNLFAAGTETTTSTVLWGLLYMLKYPEVQQKMQEEIDANIGRDRPIRLGDKVLLKYTEAVTLEIQRLGSIAPMGVAHSNFDTMRIDGYEIPPRTLITLNSYAMHRDPRYWSHPDSLHPEHFLDEQGQIKIPKGFAPFGIGKRACPGESLAKMEIYLFFANIIQNFRICASSEGPPSPEQFTVSLVRSPLPYKICIVPRD